MNKFIAFSFKLLAISHWPLAFLIRVFRGVRGGMQNAKCGNDAKSGAF